MRRAPYAKRAISRGKHEIAVGAQQRKLVTNAELCNRRVDRADLHPCTTASIAQICSVDVILPVRGEERHGRKPVDDVLTRARAGKSLKQFLQDETGDHDGLTAFKCVAQFAHLGGR